MSTKPTRQQDQACDQLARVLLDLCDAARRDGHATFGKNELREVAGLVARGSSAFDLETIILRAVETRGRSLGLRSGTAELLALVDGVGEPRDSLLLSDDDFRALVLTAEAELGDV